MLFVSLCSKTLLNPRRTSAEYGDLQTDHFFLGKIFARKMAATSKKSQKKNPKEDPNFNKSSKQPFKATKKKMKKEQNDAVKAEAVASLQLEDDEPAFPRGYSLSNFYYFLSIF